MTDSKIKIPSELFALAESSRFEGTVDIPILQIGPDDYEFDDPLTWSIDVTNTGLAFLVVGSIKGLARCSCSRCLEDAVHDFNGDIEGYFLIGDEMPERVGEDEEEPGADEFDVLPADHVLDLLPLMKAALVVDAPNMPLCRDDCAGLCPSCGANLNEGDCGCGGDDALRAFDREANPFAALADFKFAE